MGRLHLHSLVGGEGAGNIKAAWADWFNNPYGGRARIELYNPEKGASFYISKYVTKTLGEWEVLGSWPEYQHIVARAPTG
tara:strand:+ start:877 stop:1116 length:240 start_codon:yes stop_codon:yes gene_type:complete